MLVVATRVVQADDARLTQYGTRTVVSEGKVRTYPLYMVQIGKPIFAQERERLETLLHSKWSANAVQWTRKEDGSWERLEFQNPQTVEELIAIFDSYKTVERIKSIIQLLGIVEEKQSSDLPLPVRNLPKELLVKIDYMLIFYSGAIMIFPKVYDSEAPHQLLSAFHN